jgi:hypothetical protein
MSMRISAIKNGFKSTRIHSSDTNPDANIDYQLQKIKTTMVLSGLSSLISTAKGTTAGCQPSRGMRYGEASAGADK